ncbi:hypothetical protein LPN04_01695 [Rugamonas sp. A1-17]|nr:hypothetical protein [Rugamonas sp. A1-17]
MNLYPVSRSFLRHVRLQISAHFKTRIFNLVKYTKTLSVRNQHDRYSRAFFRVKLLNSHTHADSACPLASSRRDVRARSSSEKRPRRRAKKRPHQSAPYTTWVSAMPPSPAKNPHHPLPKSRALAHRLRAAVTHCFNFVAIMRQSAANGKHNTAVLAHRTRARRDARSHTARFHSPFSRRRGRAFAPATTRFTKRGKARRWATTIGQRLGDEVLARAVDGIHHLAAGLRRHRFARTFVTRARRAAQRLRGKGIHPLDLAIYEERRRRVGGTLSTAIANRIERANIVHWH